MKLKKHKTAIKACAGATSYNEGVQNIIHNYTKSTDKDKGILNWFSTLFFINTL